MAEENPTPNVEITPDPESKEAEPFPETSDNDTKGKEAEDSKPKEPEIDYRERYAQSTREAQRIMAENKAIQDELRKKEELLTQIEQEKIEYERRLRDENPESYDAYRVQQELNSLKKDIILQKERIALDDYAKQNPESSKHLEALKTLGRANPDKTYDELYNNYIKPAYEAGVKDYEARQKMQKQTQPETGKGSVDKGPVADNDMEEFNKLSLEDRKRRLKAMGY